MYTVQELHGTPVKGSAEEMLNQFRHVFYNPAKADLFVGCDMVPIKLQSTAKILIKDRLMKISDAQKPYVV